MDNVLDESKIKNSIIPKLSILFSNPREINLFRNFVLINTKIKNNFLNLINSKNPHFLKEINIVNFDEKFVFINYILFSYPEIIHEIYNDYSILEMFDITSNIDDSFNLYQDEKKEYSSKNIIQNKIHEIKDEKDIKYQNMIKIYDGFRNYIPENSYEYYIIVNNELDSLVDTFKLNKIIFQDNKFIELFEKYDKTYLSMILKSIIITGLRNHTYAYHVFSLFLDNPKWYYKNNYNEQTYNEYKNFLFELFFDLIKHDVFYSTIYNTINVSRIDDDILLYDKKMLLFGEMKLYSKKNIIIKSFNDISKRIFYEVRREGHSGNNMNKLVMYSELIRKIVFSFNSFWRLFDLDEVEYIVHDKKFIKSEIFNTMESSLNDSRQENLIDFSFEYLKLKKYVLYNKDNNFSKLNLSRSNLNNLFVHFNENEIKDIINDLVSKIINQKPIDNSYKITFESIDIMCYMLFLRIRKLEKNIEICFKKVKSYLDKNIINREEDIFIKNKREGIKYLENLIFMNTNNKYLIEYLK
jgi:hypothetical protein